MNRRGFLKGLLLAPVAALLLGLYSLGVEPAWRLRVKSWTIKRKDWKADPLRIAIVSDLHVGEPYVGLDRVRQVVERTNALGADLIVLLGDYAAGHRFISKPVKIADVAPVLADLEAPLGVYAILGNHDWWDDLSAQKRGGGPNLYGQALEASGVPVLSNAALKVRDFWLAGLEDQIALLRKNRRLEGLDDLPGTLAQITDDAPVVLLAHEPDIFDKTPDRVSLTLSGHTHGGQVRIFGWSPIVPSRFGNRFAYGHVHEEGRDLVVSGGLGCSILPVRFGVPPEITLVSIGSDAAQDT